jgi:hypothetical protein
VEKADISTVIATSSYEQHGKRSSRTSTGVRRRSIWERSIDGSIDGITGPSSPWNLSKLSKIAVTTLAMTLVFTIKADGVSFQEQDCSCVTSPLNCCRGSGAALSGCDDQAPIRHAGDDRAQVARLDSEGWAPPATLLVFEMLADPGLDDVDQGCDEGDIAV